MSGSNTLSGRLLLPFCAALLMIAHSSCSKTNTMDGIWGLKHPEMKERFDQLQPSMSKREVFSLLGGRNVPPKYVANLVGLFYAKFNEFPGEIRHPPSFADLDSTDFDHALAILGGLAPEGWVYGPFPAHGPLTKAPHMMQYYQRTASYEGPPTIVILTFNTEGLKMATMYVVDTQKISETQRAAQDRQDARVRSALESLLENGGEIDIQIGEGVQTVTAVSQLPTGRFDIVAIRQALTPGNNSLASIQDVPIKTLKEIRVNGSKDGAYAFVGSQQSLKKVTIVGSEESPVDGVWALCSVKGSKGLHTLVLEGRIFSDQVADAISGNPDIFAALRTLILRRDNRSRNVSADEYFDRDIRRIRRALPDCDVLAE